MNERVGDQKEIQSKKKNRKIEREKERLIEMKLKRNAQSSYLENQCKSFLSSVSISVLLEFFVRNVL